MVRSRRTRRPIQEESDEDNEEKYNSAFHHDGKSSDGDDDNYDGRMRHGIGVDDTTSGGGGGRERGCPNAPPDEDTLRILVSTDNHLGYLERDPIRGLDSFAALEEVLSLARQHKVDMVLLSGDLFHDNKPSRRTLHKTMEILRRYCMGSESVGFHIVSDQKDCLRSVVSGRANYEDEFYSVDLPVFAIHGNHDDPTRDGGTEMLSAIDLLAVSNLLNYFGRHDQVDNVQVSPVLLQKGTTKVALYGMGSMRDERLNRMWQGKKVRFLRPDSNGVNGGDDGECDNENGWFNIFTLHQNRDLGRGAKNCVHESMIPEWMDLVVWGHEHECLITPSESLVGTFRITQPGSSVATSLTMGEAKRKQIGILDVRGSQFRLKPVPLGSVRSFAIGEVNLGEIARNSGGGVLDAEDPKVEERMSDVLAQEVEALIEKARDEGNFLREDAEAAARAALTLEDEFDPDRRQRKYTLQNPDQVLVRLKVEHSGFTTLNNQRFGSRFVGEVANPSDILLFHRRRKAESAADGKGGTKKSRAAAADLIGPIEPEDLEDINVEDLVNDNLASTDKKMELLNERQMALALDEFVNKEQRQAISDSTHDILKKSQKQLKSRGKKDGQPSDLNPTAIREICAADAEKARADLASEQENAVEQRKKKRRADSLELGSHSNTEKRRPHDNDDNADQVEDNPATKQSRTATSRYAAAKSPAPQYDSEEEEIEEPDSPPPRKPVSKSKRAIAKTATTAKTRSRTDPDDEVEFAGTSQAPAKPAKRTARLRTTAKKPRYNYDDSDIEEVGPDSNTQGNDSSMEEIPKPKRRVAASTTKRRVPASSNKKEAFSQSTITSFTSARKPGGLRRVHAERASHSDESDEGINDPKGSGRGWGTASSQSSFRRGRR
mmetsp:Transcript_10456/g.21453  ORF Transcript_10456/g.21453 Transcript_10456/m.21453 type:complete len:890 (-) Transcript_10456:291-2960(-)